MDDVKKQKYIEFAINISITVIFAVLSLTVSSFHEHWSDEAQSYLLARDNSFLEIFQYIKYEGTPALWVIIIKIFILLRRYIRNILHITNYIFNYWSSNFRI